MGKKSRKSRNKKPVNPQVPSNNSNNNGNPSSSTPSLYEEPPVVVAEAENPVGPPDGGIICASPPIIDNVDSTNDKDNVVQNAERNDSKVDTKASDETVLIKSPTQDADLDQVQMDFTNNHNANIANSGCNENQHNKFVEPKPLVIAGPSGAGKVRCTLFFVADGLKYPRTVPYCISSPFSLIHSFSPHQYLVGRRGL
jgi:hypothetical protein